MMDKIVLSGRFASRAIGGSAAYGGAHCAFQSATARYGETRVDLEKAEDEWLSLEILREGLEG